MTASFDFRILGLPAGFPDCLDHVSRAAGLDYSILVSMPCPDGKLGNFSAEALVLSRNRLESCERIFVCVNASIINVKLPV